MIERTIVLQTQNIGRDLINSNTQTDNTLFDKHSERYFPEAAVLSIDKVIIRTSASTGQTIITAEHTCVCTGVAANVRSSGGSVGADVCVWLPGTRVHACVVRGISVHVLLQVRV